MLSAIFLSIFSCISESLELEEIAIIEDSQDTQICANQRPQTQLTNNCDLPVTIKIHDQNGLLLDFEEDIAPGRLSDWRIFDPGLVTITISTAASIKEISLDLNYCTTFDIVINPNYQLTTNLITVL